MEVKLEQRSDDDGRIEKYLKSIGCWSYFMANKEVREGKANNVWLYIRMTKQRADFFVGFCGHVNPADNGYMWYRAVFPKRISNDDKSTYVARAVEMLTAQWDHAVPGLAWADWQAKLN